MNSAEEISSSEQQFITRLSANQTLLKDELQKCDQRKIGEVTKTEFRIILEKAAESPMPSSLFDKLIERASIAVNYANSLEKIGIKISSIADISESTTSVTKEILPRIQRSATSMSSNSSDVEATFKEKLQENITKVLRGLRLFDYNRDGRIQKHELKKVFDNHVTKLTDTQFERIWNRYEINRNNGTTTTNYHDFLRRLGISNEQMANVGSGSKADKTSKSPVLPDSVIASYLERPQSNVSAFRRETSSALRPLSTFRHVVRNEDTISQQLSEANIDFLEDQLRAGVLANRAMVVKMFQIFDRDNSGTITIDELHKTIQNFVLQMSFPAFQQVMDRIGLKASHSIAWKSFMRKFDPITFGEQQNGSFLPIRSNHRYHPIKGGEQKLSVNTLLTKLHDHIYNDYPSLKEAFLQIDEAREGFVTSKKVKNILSDRAKVPVSDLQMAELWNIIQPKGSPPLSYQRFVEIFEKTETADGHKWLQSCHRSNDVRHPLPLAGQEATEIARQNLTANWSTLAKELWQYDRYHHGQIEILKLKKLLANYTGGINDATFDKWLEGCLSYSNGKVSFREFFAVIGVDINPGDLEGLSMRIIDQNAAKVDAQIESQKSRQQIDSEKAANRANSMSIDEVIVRLQDRLEQKSTSFYKTFKYYAKKRNKAYRLSRNGFRKMLSDMGFLLNDDNFAELCSRLQFTKNHMQYEDFVRNFEALFFQAPDEVERSDNHHFNEIRGGDNVLGPDEAFELFKQKLVSNFDSLKAAFDRADVDRRGVITAQGIQILFDYLNIPVDSNTCESVLQKMAAKLGKTSLNLVYLEDFKGCFEIQEDERGHKWKSDHRFNKQIEGQMPTTPEAAYQMMLLKLKSQFNSATEAFLTADARRSGRIRKRDLTELLGRIHMPLDQAMTSGVWSLIDPLGEGSVSMEAFMRRTGVENPADCCGGVSEKIIVKSDAHMEKIVNEMKQKHQQQTDRQAKIGQALTAEFALETIAQKLVDSGQSLDQLFAKYDVKKRGVLTAQQIQNILHTFHLFLSPNEEKRFFEIVGFDASIGKNTVDLEAFRLAFSDQNIVTGCEQPPVEPVVKQSSGNLNKLSYTAHNEVWRKAKVLLSQNADVMQRAFAAIDKSNSGRVSYRDFERVLSAFCGPSVPLALVKQKFPASDDGTIDYKGFLQGTVTPNVPAVAANAMLNAVSGSQEQQAGLKRLSHAVRQRHYHLTAACEELDFSRYGNIALQDFRNILQQFTFALTEQLYNHMLSLPGMIVLNENGLVNYRESLSALASFEQNGLAPSGNALPGPNSELMAIDEQAESMFPPLGENRVTSRSNRAVSVISSSRASSTIASSVITELFDDIGFGGLPMVDASKPENELIPAMAKRWRRFHRICRRADAQQNGFLPTPTVDKIFQDVGITLQDGDFQVLCCKYDLENSGKFHYRHFLRQMILTTNKKEVAKSTVNAAGKPDTAAPMIRALLSTAERWRDLRKWFRSQPQATPGMVSINQLRHGFRTVGETNMSEEGFADLTSQLDPNNSGFVRFDDLFRMALKSTTKA